MELLAEIKKRKLTSRFDFFGGYPYLQMLQDQIAGKNNSWAVRWYASALLADKLTLYPGRSLVRNIGCDDSGQHCKETEIYNADMWAKKTIIGGCEIKEDMDSLVKMSEWLKDNHPGVLQRAIRRGGQFIKSQMPWLD